MAVPVRCLDCGAEMRPVESNLYECTGCGVRDSGHRGPYPDVRPAVGPLHRVEHQPSGDWAEAYGYDAALLAAETLLKDNDHEGSCRVFRGGNVIDVVWSTVESVRHLQMRGRE